MPTAPAMDRTLTAGEYLAAERVSALRHEFWQGQMTAMSGASRHHVRLRSNLSFLLQKALDGRDCFVGQSNMRVHAPSGLYAYPDLFVTCDEPRHEDGAFDTLLNPSLLIEVLSDSTEAYDRGAKFERYQSLPSLRDYLLVTQDVSCVEHHSLLGASEWRFRVFSGLDETIRIDHLSIELPMREIYRSVPLPSSPDDVSA